MKALLRAWAVGFGSGFFPVAPGTAGSLVGLAAWCCIPGIPLGGDGSLGLSVLVFLAAAFALGVVASGPAQEEFGKDGGPIVCDEVVGQWVAVAGLAPTPATCILGFLLFRVFDVFKPFPARQSEKLGGGLGVMADDVVAGIYAALGVRLVLWLVPDLG